MATQVKKRSAKAPIAAAVALLFALLGGVLSLGAAWGDDENIQAANDQGCDNNLPIDGHIVSTDSASSGVPYSVVSTDYLFPSRLELDPSLSTSFAVTVEGTSEYVSADVTDKPLHNDNRGPLGKYQNAFDFKYNKLGGGSGDDGGGKTDIGAQVVAFGSRDNTEKGNAT